MIEAGLTSETEYSLAAPAALDALIGELEARHPRVKAHCQAVAVLAARVARQLGAGARGVTTVRLAGPVHDVGKLAVPRQILEKPGSLTPAEWQLVRRHPSEGERLLQPVFGDRREVLAAVRFHHERWDGNGYPDGLVGAEAPLAARIIAVADAFHAMLETRPYRSGRPSDHALDELEEHSGTQFDPECVEGLRLALRS